MFTSRRVETKLEAMMSDGLLLLADCNYWVRDKMLDAVFRLTPDQSTRPVRSPAQP